MTQLCNSIRLRGVVMEDFVNYRLPSMFLISSFCDWKCCHDGGFSEKICQNNNIINIPIKEFSYSSLLNAYVKNKISKAIVVGGLEPLKQFDEIYGLINYFRQNEVLDTFVIYTGYDKQEICEQIDKMMNFKNIIIKFGRYVPNQKEHYDEILGINLASSNQYAEVIC